MTIPTLTRPRLRTDETIKLAICIRQAWDHSPCPPELEPLIYAIDAANQAGLADFGLAMYRLGIGHALGTCEDRS